MRKTIKKEIKRVRWERADCASRLNISNTLQNGRYFSPMDEKNTKILKLKNDGKSLRQSFNFLIQSAGADFIRIACVKLYNFARKYPAAGIKLLMTVHDEIVFACNEEYADRMVELSEKILESCVGKDFVVPLSAEAKAGDNYAQVK